jgi:hypothetical protein
MAYNPVTDLIGLLRRTTGGMRQVQMPGLDFVVAALSRANMIDLSVSMTAPISNQSTTAWFKPYDGASWVAEGTLFLWNDVTSEYEPATPHLWQDLLVPTLGGQFVQDVSVAGPTNIDPNAAIVRVLNVGSAVTLVLPAAVNKNGPVLVSDWQNQAGTNNITIQCTGADVFPNGVTTWTVAGDGGSAFFRPVSGGYVL